MAIERSGDASMPSSNGRFALFVTAVILGIVTFASAMLAMFAELALGGSDGSHPPPFTFRFPLTMAVIAVLAGLATFFAVRGYRRRARATLGAWDMDRRQFIGVLIAIGMVAIAAGVIKMLRGGGIPMLLGILALALLVGAAGLLAAAGAEATRYNTALAARLADARLRVEIVPSRQVYRLFGFGLVLGLPALAVCARADSDLWAIAAAFGVAGFASIMLAGKQPQGMVLDAEGIENAALWTGKILWRDLKGICGLDVRARYGSFKVALFTCRNPDDAKRVRRQLGAKCVPPGAFVILPSLFGPSIPLLIDAAQRRHAAAVGS